MAREQADVVVVGAGHNGLVAALLLARAGLKVRVLEEQNVIGGACRTETPFANVPGLKHSTGAYLLGLMPPELVQKLSLDLPLLRRDPHYFLPTTSQRYLLFGSDHAAFETQMRAFFSERDLRAHTAMQAELAMLREDLAESWLREPLSIEETAARYVRPELQQVFVSLVRGSIAEYLARFEFESALIQAMYAVTDAFSGLSGGWDTPGTGHNFLVHNMCRLPGSDGTWMIVQGGMGTVTQKLARAAEQAAAKIEVGVKVHEIRSHAGQVQGVTLADGREIDAPRVVVNADPFRMRELVGGARLPAEYNKRLDDYVRPGTTLKLNLALKALPRFTCMPEERGQHRTTTHLLPQDQDIVAALRRGHAEALAGKLPENPTIEWYFHTTVDPSLQDAGGHHSSALFVQWAPNRVAGSSWAAEGERYADHLLDICERFAPGTKALVADRMLLHPEAIEERFGIRHGHIHHVDNGFAFADRLPYRTPIAGLYSASAGCHPAGSVIGASGHNCAEAVLKDQR
jgi:phytoene dehydrogenase-like protein